MAPITNEVYASVADPLPRVLTTAQSSRKRKREDEKILLGNAILIHPFETLESNPVRLTPILLLPRSSIPLHFISQDHTPRLFGSTCIRCLSLPSNVLIVRSDADKQHLCYIEVIQEGVYSLGRLDSQIKVREIRKLAGSSKRLAVSSFWETWDGWTHHAENNWWEIAGVSCYDGLKDCLVPRSPGSAKEVQCVGKLLPVAMTGSESVPTAPDTATKHTEVDANNIQAIFDMVKFRYFDTLYKSKGSIAYLPKSAFTRARVCLQEMDTEATSHGRLLQLIAFLKTLVTRDVSLSDKKYSSAMIRLYSSAEHDTPALEELFRPGEEAYAAAWADHARHRSRLDSFSDEEELVEYKKRASRLRTRETEMQVVVLLEILALKAELGPQADAADGPRPPEAKKKKSFQSVLARKKAKAAEPVVVEQKVLSDQDLLYFLVDRLCIWQSIESPVIIEDSVRLGGNVQGTSQSEETDALRNFCVEVVQAFYAGKLPEVTAHINRTAFGPPQLPDVHLYRKERTRKNSSYGLDGRTIKPGEAVESLGVRKSSLKRSTSSAGLDSLKANKATSKPRGGLLDTKRFRKQEVELDMRRSRSLTVEPGAKFTVDSQLRDAIQGLAKPNRSAMASAAADDAKVRESSQSSTKKSGRKANAPVRNPMANIQVASTPRVATRIDKSALAKSQQTTLPNLFGKRSKLADANAYDTDRGLESDNDAPASSAPIPETVRKPSNGGFKIPSTPCATTDTPTKMPSKLRGKLRLLNSGHGEVPQPALGEMDVAMVAQTPPPSSPIFARGSTLKRVREEDEPSTPEKKSKLGVLSIQVTPNSKSMAAFPGQPPRHQSEHLLGQSNNPGSIYQQLGWDD